MENKTTSNLSETKRVECSGCNQCKILWKIITLQKNRESISEPFNEHREDLKFIQAVVWLQRVIASVQEISREDFLSRFSSSHRPRFQDLLANAAERSNSATFAGADGDEYEPQISSQSSVDTVDLLFRRPKSSNNDEKKTRQRQPEIIQCSEAPDDLPTFVRETTSPENGNDHLLEYDSSGSNDLFSSSSLNSTYRNISQPMSDNADYTLAELGSSNEFTQGNPLQSFRSFPVMSSLTGTSYRNSLKRRVCSFTERSNNFDETIINNCTPLAMMEADDSGYGTMNLIPHCSKTKIPPHERDINFTGANENSQEHSSRKYRKVDSPVTREILPEPGSPQRWTIDSAAERQLIISDSDAESEVSGCSFEESSSSSVASKFKYDKFSISPRSASASSVQSTTSTLGSLKSCLIASSPNRSQLRWASTYETENDSQRLTDIITPESSKSRCQSSVRSSVEFNFSPMSSSNISNNSRLQEELVNSTGNTSKTLDFAGSDVMQFTPAPTQRSVAEEETEKLSSAYLDFALKAPNVDEACLKSFTVILACFEDGSITSACMKRRRWANTLEQEALQTLVNFCCTVEAQTKTNKYTRAIVLMLYRLFDKAIEETTNFNMKERSYHVSIALEFLYSKEVCIDIINPLIIALESSTRDLVSCISSKRRLKSFCKLQIVMFAVRIALNKYRLICADTEDQEEHWIDVLEELFIILLDHSPYRAMEVRVLKNILCM